MVTHAQRSPETAQHHPTIDPQLHYRLKSKFGEGLLKEGFTGIPVLIQRYYRRVPGNPLPCEDGTPGSEPSYMTPTEFDVMTDMWSYPHSAVQNDTFLNNKDSHALLLLLLVIILLRKEGKVK